MNKTKIIIVFTVTINHAFTYLANPVTNAHLGQGRLIMAHLALFSETSLLLHALVRTAKVKQGVDLLSISAEYTVSNVGAHPYFGLSFPDIY